jgi:uncharacterized repeat protein (TIGR01451 family)
VQTPAFMSFRSTRQFFFILALIALVVSAGCNSAKTETVGPAFSVASSHAGNFSIGQQSATYTVTVTNSGNAATNGSTVTATDTVPSGMTLVSMTGSGWTCAGNSCTRTDVLAAGASYPAITVTVNVSATATSPETNQVSASGGGAPTTAATGSDSTTINTPILSITSAHSGSFVQSQQGVYTVTVSNASGANIVPTIGTVSATDTVPSGMTLVSMSGTGWTCTTLPTCTRSDALAVGASYPAITVTVNVNANATTPESNSVNVSGGGSPSASGADSTVILTAPTLTISKSHVGNFSQAQQGATYSVTVSNATGAAATNGTVTVTEAAPSGLTLAAMSGTGWTCTALPVCTRADALAGGASYPAITVTVNVLANATTPQINSVSVSGGGSASANTTNSTTILAPALAITKAHTGSFALGQQNAVYTVTVSNGASAGTTSGTVTVTDTVPAGETLVSMAGTGWTCTTLPSCTRADALAAGASYPAITVTVNVAANATTPQVNAVSVTGGNSASANTTDSTIILEPALSVTKSHTGNFSQGQQNAAYTVTVSNGQNAGGTAGTVTVTDTAPSGETLVSMSGTGWICTTLPTCTRTDSLAGGASYPTITVTVNVAANAVSPQVNAVAATGGGSPNANTNDSTTILAPALSITKTHQGSFALGQQNAPYTVTVSNAANAGTTSGTVTVTEAVPSGETLVSMSGTGWTCTVLPTCTRADGLVGGASYPAITVLVNVAANATSPQINDVGVTGGNSPAANVTDSTTIAIPVLGIVKSHIGNFSQNQLGATYTVSVSNGANAGATTGTVSMTDTVPAGETLVSMSGTGWTCTTLPTCTRTDSLAGGTSYPAITVTVNVAANASSPQINAVSVSGGGSVSANTTDPTTVLAPALGITKSHVGNFSQNQSGATYAVTVSNGANAGTTSGTVTVTEAVPSGLTLVSMSGTGWTCTTLPSCTRNDALLGGASYPAITVTVNVAANASSPQVNSVGVTGGGSPTANTTDSTIVLAPALAVVKTPVGSFSQGQQGAQYTIAVSNPAGAGTTGGTVSVTDTVPADGGETLVSMSGTGWTCTTLSTCTRNDALPGGSSYPVITVTVNISLTANPTETNSVQVIGGNSPTANGSAPTTILVPRFSISKSPNGNGVFLQGQVGATYSVVVMNSGGAGTTVGTVTVTDTPPSGETITAMSGTGWTCTTLPTCTRSDALAGGSNYPTITVTVNVSNTATSPQINAVSVSGGNSAPANTTAQTIIGLANPCANAPTGNESLFAGQYAFELQGWQGSGNGQPFALAGTFGANGAGGIEGLGSGFDGEYDFNSPANGPQHFLIPASGAFALSSYKVGPDSTGAGFTGCLTIQPTLGGTPFTVTFSLGKVVGGIATEGRIIEFDDQTGTATRAAGLIRAQDITAFINGGTTHLDPNYAIGLDGQSTQGHFALAGSFAMTPAQGGAFTAITLDVDNAGQLGTNLAASGSIPFSSIRNSSQDGVGMMTLNYTLNSAPVTMNSNIYIVNANEFFIIGTDPISATNPIQIGRAIVSAPSYTSAAVAGNQILHVTGQNTCTENSAQVPCASAAIGLLNFSVSTTTAGTLTGDIYNYDIVDGASAQNFPAANPGTFTLTNSSGRVALANVGNHPPVLYLASPASNTDPVTAFIVGTDSSAIFGSAEAGAASAIATSSLAGNYFFGNEDPADNTVKNQIGVVTVSSGGVISGSSNTSGQNGLQINGSVTGTVAITNLGSAGNGAPGTGNVGTQTIAITNGKRLIFIDESGGPAMIVIVELQ